MGKIVLILLSLIFTLSLQAKTPFNDPKKDPNLKVGQLKNLQKKLPHLNVTSGVCTSPNGCQEDKVAQASLNVQDPFDKEASKTNQKAGDTSPSDNAQ